MLRRVRSSIRLERYMMHDKMKLDYNNLTRLIMDGGKHET